MKSNFNISETMEHGLILKVFDTEMADRLDDYLTETCYVFYTQRPTENCVEFFFGQVGSPEKLDEILNRFLTEKS